jgi:hypothetical protein
MKYFSFILLISIPLASSVILDCKFEDSVWDVMFGQMYSCRLISNPAITDPGMVVTAVNGNHVDSMSNANVTGLRTVQLNVVNYMPLGISHLLPNLDSIIIESSHLQELRQSDLQQFPKLKYLNIYINDIKTLERDLFKFNPMLAFIRLYSNKIMQVHPTAFDNLNNLAYLDLNDNVCITGDADTGQKIVILIQQMKDQCQLDNYLWVYKVEEDLRGINLKIQKGENFQSCKNAEAEIKELNTRLGILVISTLFGFISLGLFLMFQTCTFRCT